MTCSVYGAHSLQVLKAVGSCSAHNAAHSGWVDRLQALECLHADDAKAFYFRHHADIFVPLLQLTGLPSGPPTSAHEAECSEARRGSCLGCALKAERDAWVVARVTRSAADPTLEHDDTITHRSLPRKVRAFSAAVHPLLASIPLDLAEQLAAVMGVSVQDRPNTRPGPPVATARAAPQSPFAALWRRVTVPADSALDDAIEARPLGHPSSGVVRSVASAELPRRH